MAGLIQNAMQDQTTKPVPAVGTSAAANTVSADPAMRSVDAAKETVSGQLDKLLASDSPYIKQAEAGAMQTANQRGLINSSMAAGAGRAAAIGAALPVAQADASAYSGVSKDNQTATNAALSQGADASNKAAMFNADAQNQQTLQTQKGAQAISLADIEANYKTLMQTSSSASQVFSETQNQMAAILNNPNTSPEQKASAIESVKSMLQSSLTVIGAISNTDLAGLLDFSTPGYTPPPAPEPAPDAAPPASTDSPDGY